MQPINFIRDTSIPLPGGGDTHYHPWKHGTGYDVTTRLRDEIVFHEHVRLSRLYAEPPHPEVLQQLPFP